VPCSGARRQNKVLDEVSAANVGVKRAADIRQGFGKNKKRRFQQGL
jgi:hypothetical protein